MSNTDTVGESSGAIGRSESISAMQCIVSVCRFESEWENGRGPRAEDFVAHRPAEEQAELIPRLLAAEMSLRRRFGEEPRQQELDERFPDHPAFVKNALRHEVVSLGGDGDEPGNEQRQFFGRYRVIGRLGAGGFGVVYGAYDDALRRMVAIKVPHARWSQRQDFADSYLTEARVLARLDHPNIVPVFDCGETADGRPFVVSKFIEGHNLAERLAQGRPPFAETRAMIAEIADALHCAHLQGLVHRDVKPGNILIDSAGKAYLADFGIVLREEDYGQGPSFLGTPSYMSPEQARSEGHRVDGRSDIFSLGVVLFQLLTGRRPFHGQNERELLTDVLESKAQPPRQIDDTIPRDLERICLKALSKRAADRYSTAQDMADDLRFGASQDADCIARQRSPETNGILPLLPAPTAGAAPQTDPIVAPIVPKGLRSFDAHDADFFLELLPGPRDRDGLPESLRFWKTRIEEMDSDETFSVGLIYGPSGCGKSSFIKAGLLPRLAPTIHAIYLEATPHDTESRLLHSLSKKFPSIRAEELSLQEFLAALRRGQGLPRGHKALIVIDQFEQWLHTHGDDDKAALMLALRQCDAARLQVILLVRDDFWMSVSRLFDHLEIPLNWTRNARAMSLFDDVHARRVLRLFGEAHGRLPPSPQSLSAEQKDFLRKAISDLSLDGHVIPVRLSLFADMMRSRAWTAASLSECGGADGVGVRFLEETFSGRTALPELRMWEQPARRLLQALLPDRGADIKGRMRSRRELADAAELTQDARRFDRLIEMLDRDLHILTPTEPPRDPGQPAHAEAQDTETYYQLTHDYLVPSLRQWLTRERQKTWRGRAELCLEERTRQWSLGREPGFLPSVLETAKIAVAVPARNRSPDQKAMMRAARRHHGFRWGGIAAALGVLLVAIWIQQWVHESTVVREIVQDLLIASPQGVAQRIERLRGHESDAVPLLTAAFRDPSAEDSKRLHAAYGLAALGAVDRQYLIEAIPNAASGECPNLVDALRPVKDSIADELLARAIDPTASPASAARYASVSLFLGDPRAARSLASLGPDLTRRTALILGLENWHGDLTPVADVLRTANDGPLCSALCAAISLLPSEQLRPAERRALQTAVAALYQTTSDRGAHSAAGLVLRKWKWASPAAVPTSNRNREWFVNAVGMTMIRIEPGRFRMGGASEANSGDVHDVVLTKGYFLSDRPVTVSQFQSFVNDPQCPSELKPRKWPGHSSSISPTADHPINSVNWMDAILFCNWLSKQCNLEPCYESSAKPGDPEEVAVHSWKWVRGKKGYRLPTEAEREYACRAGTTTRFHFGNDESLLPRFGVCRESKMAPCGDRLPNAWGLFDMHGNAHQWCWDYRQLFDGQPAIDPVGPAEGKQRTLRGGSFSSVPHTSQSSSRTATNPILRVDNFSLRVALDY